MRENNQLCNTETAIVKQAIRIAGMSEGSYEIQKINAGMTNHLYSFLRNKKKYLIRIPGEGTEFLVNRQHELEVYQALAGKGIAENVLYINAENGIKITEFLDNAHTCNINASDEVRSCLQHLKQLHKMKLHVAHEFDIYKKIEAYERCCQTEIKHLPNHEFTRTQIMNLKPIIHQKTEALCLCHIDPITDNFLINGAHIYLIDWEYAAMCDPHIDIAMLAIYSELTKAKTDRIIDEYFDHRCTAFERKKIYAYMAASAFLWVLWAEIKTSSGENYRDYQKKQYEIAKEFCAHARNCEVTL